MDIWQLKIFCKVVELKSFSKAGAAVHISQPTVSSHIKYLEEFYGIKLIDRLAKEAIPTKAGELLYTYAKRILALRHEAESAMAEFQGNMKGKLTLGGSNIPGVYLLPKILGAFKKKYPRVELALVIRDTEEIVHGILAGDLELGIVGAVSNASNIFQEVLIEDELCLVVPAAHALGRTQRIGLDRLLKEPFIIREKGSGTLKSFQLSFARHGFQIEQLNVVAEIGSTAAVIQAVKNGVGVSILSRIAVSEESAAGLLHTVALDGIDLKRNFYLTWHKQRSLSPLNTACIAFLKQAF
jgi:DNA-binding transcriptional LysR family regulator